MAEDKKEEINEVIIAKPEMDGDDKFTGLFESINKNVIQMTKTLLGLSKSTSESVIIQKDVGEKLTDTISDTTRENQFRDVAPESTSDGIGDNQNIATDVATGNIMAGIVDSIKDSLFSGGLISKVFKGVAVLAITPLLVGAAAGVINGLFGADYDGDIGKYIQDPGLLKAKIAGIVGGAVAVLLKGPIGIIGSVVTASMISGFENLTGIEIPNMLKGTLVAMGGIFGIPVTAGMTKLAFRQLIKRAVIGGTLRGSLGMIMGAALSPIGLLVAGIGGAILGAGYLLSKAATERERQNFQEINDAIESGDPDELRGAANIINNEYDNVGGLVVDETQRQSLDDSRTIINNMLREDMGDIQVPQEILGDERQLLSFFMGELNRRKEIATTQDDLRNVYSEVFNSAMKAGLSADALYDLPIYDKDSLGTRMVYELSQVNKAPLQDMVRSGIQSLIDITSKAYMNVIANEKGIDVRGMIPPLELSPVDDLVGLPGNPKVRFDESGSIVRRKNNNIEVMQDVQQKTGRLNTVKEEAKTSGGIALVNSGNVYNAPDNRKTSIVAGGGSPGVSRRTTTISYGSDHLKGAPASRMY